jgi:hypothetical protein
VIRLIYGSLLLIAPGRLVGRGRDRADARFRFVARVLGARHVLQAVVTALRPTATVRRGGAVVDCLHAATDLGCAVLDRRRRGPASVDAGVALALAAATVTTGPARARRAVR